MYQLAETKDSRIAEYTFGKSITQFGVRVFSCTSARKGKKIFANDPDPLKEYVLDTQTKLVKAHIKKHPKGKVAGYKDIIKEIGPLNQVHHRTVMFGSTWKSDSLKPAGKSILYHNGAHTHFRYNGIARITSQEQDGVIACSGFDDLRSTNRNVHFLKDNDSFTPAGIGSIIVPMHDVWYHKTKLLQHYPFPISEADTVQITVSKPTVIVEFTQEEPDVAKFTQDWLNQIEDGLIEIIDR
tara:strand:- start:1132 stop:1851 length:720 start_codon:yes stop_codon:yes gene_type:complete